MDKDTLEDRLDTITADIEQIKAMLMELATFTTEVKEAMSAFQDNGFLSNILGGLLGSNRQR